MSVSDLLAGYACAGAVSLRFSMPWQERAHGAVPGLLWQRTARSRCLSRRKGELHSWEGEGRSDFALPTGTQASKSADQIATGPNAVNSWAELSARSVDALKAQPGEQKREQFGVKAGPLELATQGIVGAGAGCSRELALDLRPPP